MDVGTIIDTLRALRNRAGLTMGQAAEAMGYRGQSSYQRFESPATYDKRNHLELSEARKLSIALVGRGAPEITKSEIYKLLDLSSEEKDVINGLDSTDQLYPGTVVHEAIFFLQDNNVLRNARPAEAAEAVMLCCDVLMSNPEGKTDALAEVISLDIERKQRQRERDFRPKQREANTS